MHDLEKRLGLVLADVTSLTAVNTKLRSENRAYSVQLSSLEEEVAQLLSDLQSTKDDLYRQKLLTSWRPRSVRSRTATEQSGLTPRSVPGTAMEPSGTNEVIPVTMVTDAADDADLVVIDTPADDYEPEIISENIVDVIQPEEQSFRATTAPGRGVSFSDSAFGPQRPSKGTMQSLAFPSRDVVMPVYNK